MQLGHMGKCGMIKLYKKNLLKGEFKIATHKTSRILDHFNTNV